MVKKKLVIIGTATYSTVVKEAAELAGYSILGFVDPFNSKKKSKKKLLSLQNIKKLKKNFKIIIAIGDNKKRKFFFEYFKKNSFSFASVIHPSALVANTAKIEIGSFVSVGAIVNSNAKIFKNSMIKGGLVNLARQLASYYGRYGIRVNNICSGGISGHVAGKSNFQNKQFIKNYENKVPLKRLGDPGEVANVITFIASDASSYITGSNVLVDGGWTII